MEGALLGLALVCAKDKGATKHRALKHQVSHDFLWARQGALALLMQMSLWVMLLFKAVCAWGYF
jgi:hypothetical protein